VRRREVITLIGGAVAVWPLAAARAQQPDRMRRIGVLITIAADDPEAQSRLTTFRATLEQLGWTERRNVQIDARFGGGDADRIRKSATELVALAPDVILVNGSPTLAPLLQLTRTIPIVFVIVADPVGAGFVDSLAQPGGNAAGFTTYDYSISAKWLELLKEIAPSVKRMGVLRDPALTLGTAQSRRSASGYSVTLTVPNADLTVPKHPPRIVTARRAKVVASRRCCTGA